MFNSLNEDNPPYVEYSKVRNKYTLLTEYSAFSTNLYSACCYRASKIKRSSGYTSFIVPVSLPSTDRMEALRLELGNNHNIYHVSFSTRPGKLFEGAEQRLTIFIQVPKNTNTFTIYSGGYLKWSIVERPSLFPV